MTSVVLILMTGGVGQVPPPDSRLRTFFDAIRTVETGGETHPEHAVGDGGRSLGPYQISRKYLMDSGLHGDWRRCREAKFSEAVMLAYWKRHCPEALRTKNYEVLARVHNGGPKGQTKVATAAYWKRVREVMKSKQPANGRIGPSGRKRARTCA